MRIREELSLRKPQLWSKQCRSALVFSTFGDQSAFFAGKLSASRVEQVVNHISKLQDFVERLQKLEVDPQEYAYLKSMALFSAGKNTTTVAGSSNLVILLSAWQANRR